MTAPACTVSGSGRAVVRVQAGGEPGQALEPYIATAEREG